MQVPLTTLGLGGLVAKRGFDVFGYNNAGVLALDTTQWTSATARATPLVMANGFLCKSGDPTRRYLGSFYTGLTATTYDITGGTSNDGSSNGGKRFVWNMYNRVPRPGRVSDQTSTWTCNSATWRIMRGATSPQNGVEIFTGLAEDLVTARGTINAYTASNGYGMAGIGVDSATPNTNNTTYGATSNLAPGNFNALLHATYADTPAYGYHVISMCEIAPAGSFQGGPGYGCCNMHLMMMA
jgi:hypothetical protein